ncbi:MAG: deoxyribodipyrimidine photo-lyase, partial [Candidatus Paceibacteria bacterium]
MYHRVLWWIKRDFRLFDNEALVKAIASSKEVIPVFMFEPSLLGAEETSYFHVHAWWQALQHVQQELQTRGSDLLYLYADLPYAFEYLSRYLPFEAVFSHQETGSNVTYARDIRVKQWCDSQQVMWHEYRQNGVVRGLQDRDSREAS